MSVALFVVSSSVPKKKLLTNDAAVVANDHPASIAAFPVAVTVWWERTRNKYMLKEHR